MPPCSFILSFKYSFPLPGTETDALRAKAIVEVITNVERQLSSMSYFEEGADENEMLKFAPLTNLGCESQMASLDNRLKVSGGTTCIQTLSNKAVVKSNRYLEHEDFVGLSPGERKLLWITGKSGDKAVEVRELLADFNVKVEVARELVVENRRDLKRKKAERLSKLIIKCQDHGGPVCRESIGLVAGLDEDQVLAEMSVLRALGFDAKSKRLVTDPGGKKFFQLFALPQLKETICQTVAPTNKVTKSVEELLKGVAFKATSFKIGAKVQKGFWDEKQNKIKMYQGKVTKLYTRGPQKGEYLITYDDGDTESVLLAEIENMLCVL